MVSWLLILVCFLSGTCLAVEQPASDDLETVGFEIHLKTWDERSLEGLYLFVYVDHSDEWSLMHFDHENNGFLELQLPRHGQRRVGVSFNVQNNNGISVESEVQNSATRNIFHRMHWGREYFCASINTKRPIFWLNIPENVACHNIDLELERTTKISGRLINSETGHPVRRLTVRARLGSSYIEGSTTIDGVLKARTPPGRKNELFLVKTPYVYSIPLSLDLVAEQSSVDIGVHQLRPTFLLDTWELFEYAKSEGRSLETLRIQLDRWEDTFGHPACEDAVLSLDGIALISTDGSTIILLPWPNGLNAENLRTMRSGRQPDLPRIPYGKYYVVPHFFIAHHHQLAVLDAARDGVDLEPLGIPVLQVTDSQELEVHKFDAVEIVEAIQRFLDANNIKYVDGYPQQMSSTK